MPQIAACHAFLSTGEIPDANKIETTLKTPNPHMGIELFPTVGRPRHLRTFRFGRSPCI